MLWIKALIPVIGVYPTQTSLIPNLDTSFNALEKVLEVVPDRSVI